MADLYRSDITDVDLNKSLVRSYAGELLATGDKLSNRYGVRVFRQGAAVNLSGYAVTGYFIRPDMETVVITGAVSGNVAYVDLPQACYTQQGQFTLAVKVSGGGITQTVRIVDGYIRTTQTGTLIDPGSVIPTLDELFAQIAAMEQATAEATTATQEAKQATADTKAATQEIMTTSAPAIVPTVTGALVSVTDGASRPAVQVVTHLEPMQEGSGEASPSNVRPFKAFDSATLDVTNTNLLGGMHLAEVLREQAGATINTGEGTVRFASSGGGNRTLIGGNVFKSGKRYTVILYGRNIGGKYSAANIAIGYTDGSYDGLNFPSLNENSCLVYTSQHGKDVSKVFAFIGADTTDLYYNQCGVFEGVVTADALIPAYGKRCSASLPESLYGADIDWLSGKVHKRYHRIVFDGVTVGAKVDVTDPGMTTYAYVQSWNMPKPLKNGGKAYANKLRSVGTNTVISFSLPAELTGVTSSDSVADVVSKYNTLLKQWHDASTPLEIVYEVENPEEIQFTPQEIDTQKGVNNAWSSTGDTGLTYVADTKLYIDNKFTELRQAILSTGANV